MIENPFVPCVVCGEEFRYLSMYTCIECEEPLCKLCYLDGFCSDDCRSFYEEAVNAGEEWENEEPYVPYEVEYADSIYQREEFEREGIL